jgi:ATP-dependent DNA helicase RecG
MRGIFFPCMAFSSQHTLNPLDILASLNWGESIEPHSVHINEHSVHKEKISQDQRDALLLIADPARRNRRLAPTEMEQVILKLCRGSWLTRRQLADLLDRNLDGLRSRFLTQMVGHGLLQLPYPDKPNRVDQAYSSSQSIE